MKNIKTIISLVLVMAMMTSVALAAGEEIIYKEGSPKSPSGYHERDLFDNFKNVMPGDKLSETITILNDYSGCDYIKVFMRAIVHDENGNPLQYDEAFENTDGKDQTTVSGVRDETVATMHEFLSQLTMRVYDAAGNKIYESSPDKTAQLTENVLLDGELRKGEETTITVELDVPLSLGNRYANRVGEVDWVFPVEEHFDPDEPDNPTTSAPTTAPTTGPTSGPTEPTEEITDPDIPLNPVDPDSPDSPDTGDHSNMLPYIVMFIIGLMGLILTSKKRKTN